MASVSVAPSPQEGVEEEKGLKERVRKSVAIVDGRLLKTIQLNGKTLISSAELKRIFDVEIINVKDGEFKIEPGKYYIVNLKNGKVLDDEQVNNAEYVVDIISTEYTEPYVWSKNVEFDTYNEVNDVIMYEKSKAAIVVRDVEFDRNLEVTIFKWSGDKPTIKIYRFHYGDDSKEKMLEYVKKLINVMEPYL